MVVMMMMVMMKMVMMMMRMMMVVVFGFKNSKKLMYLCHVGGRAVALVTCKHQSQYVV